MVEVYWAEQVEADVPQGDGWLGARERDRQRGFRFAKRLADWRLGRWTAKRAVAALLGMCPEPGCLADIEILAAPSGAPEVSLNGRLSPIQVSISHSTGMAACALVHSSALVGCDIEAVSNRESGFLRDYFTPGEQALVLQAPAPDRPLLETLLWSAKESVLKALKEGLRLDTRLVEVTVNRQAPASAWLPLRATLEGKTVFDGWWSRKDLLVRTVAARPSPGTPVAVVL